MDTYKKEIKIVYPFKMVFV